MSGVWRDRTNLYISYRQSYAHHPAKKRKTVGSSANGFSASGYESEERRGLMSAGAFDDDGDAVIEMDLLPPRWVDIQDEVTDLLATIAKKSADLEKMHQKHVLPGFDDEDVKRQEEVAIERLTQDITRGFHDCQKAIQRIEMMVRDARHQGGVSAADETMARNIQISLASRVQEVSAGFRKKQSNYLKKLRILGGLTFDRTSAPSQNPYSDPSMTESETDKSFSQSTLQQTSMKRLKTNDVAIAQREREIEDIAQGIIELADIFKELQGMVIDQGTMLDRIDYNIENMSVNVKAADKELNVATGYQKKYTKRKILFLLFLLVIGMFILLLVKPKRTKAPPPPPSADPIGTMGEVKPQPDIAASKPDIVQPNSGNIASEGTQLIRDIHPDIRYIVRMLMPATMMSYNGAGSATSSDFLSKSPSSHPSTATLLYSPELSVAIGDLPQSMADSFSSTPFEIPSSSSEGKAAMPRPPLPKCQASIVDGMCETTMRVVTQERRIRFDILTKKQNVITELLTRLQRWNDMQCRYCKTALRDQGPRVPAMYELVYIENPDVFKRRVALGEELPDNTEVLARLARTGEYLAHLRGDGRTEAGSSTSISPTGL